jgi:hypothetical protein
MFCTECQEEVETEENGERGFVCCVQCGNVLTNSAFASDVTFTKGADGSGAATGQYVGDSGEARSSRYAGGRMWSSSVRAACHMLCRPCQPHAALARLKSHDAYFTRCPPSHAIPLTNRSALLTEPHRRALLPALQGDTHAQSTAKGRNEISLLVESFSIRPRDEAVEAAHRLYLLALHRNFTRGRRISHVAAVALYVFCRQENKPYMLIDFSDQLQVRFIACLANPHKMSRQPVYLAAAPTIRAVLRRHMPSTAALSLLRDVRSEHPTPQVRSRGQLRTPAPVF